MAADEPASGYNLPPGCLDGDIDRAFGQVERRCGECRHCIWSGELDRCVCGLRLDKALAGPGGTRRLPPGHILAAVEGAVTDEWDCCAAFEG